MNNNKNYFLLLLYIFIISRIIIYFFKKDNFNKIAQNISPTQNNYGYLYKIKTNIQNNINYKYVDTKCTLIKKNKSITNANVYNILNNSIKKNIDKTLVTIIIPVYNTTDSIIDSIASVLNQTYKNMEVIVINDASTDSSLQKIKSISDPRVKIFNNKENYGTYVSLNIGLKVSLGNYILIHGSDDYLTTDCISTFVDNLKQSNLNMAYSNWARGFFLQKCPEGNFMFKRHVLDSLGFFDNTRFSGDTEFITRYKLKYNNELLFIDGVLNIATVRPKSLTHNEQTTYKSQSRQLYKLNYLMYHRTISKTNNYYMPFLYNQNIYKKYNYQFNPATKFKKVNKNISLQDVGQVVK